MQGYQKHQLFLFQKLKVIQFWRMWPRGLQGGTELAFLILQWRGGNLILFLDGGCKEIFLRVHVIVIKKLNLQKSIHNTPDNWTQIRKERSKITALGL